MQGLDKIREKKPLMARMIVKQGGFINNQQVEEIKQFAPFLQLLIRCGAGRFVCAAQDAIHFSDIIDREESDYVRDISLLAD